EDPRRAGGGRVAHPDRDPRGRRPGEPVPRVRGRGHRHGVRLRLTQADSKYTAKGETDMTELQKMGAAAKKAAAVLRTAGEKKRRALLEAAQALRAAAPEILAANAVDLAAARESGMRDAMLDRLMLTEARIEAMAQGVEDVAAQRDPVGRVLSG